MIFLKSAEDTGPRTTGSRNDLKSSFPPCKEYPVPDAAVQVEDQEATAEAAKQVEAVEQVVEN